MRGSGHVCMYVCMYVFLCVCLSVCLSVCMYVCMHVGMYVFMYTSMLIWLYNYVCIIRFSRIYHYDGAKQNAKRIHRLAENVHIDQPGPAAQMITYA